VHIQVMAHTSAVLRPAVFELGRCAPDIAVTWYWMAPLT
jgi:hypothetical protein